MNITTEWLEERNACREGVEWFINQKESDGIKVIKKLIKEKQLDWANWTIVRMMSYPQYVSYAIYAAKQVIDIYERRYPDNKKPREAIEAAKKCLKDPSQENKHAAHAAADAAMKTKILKYGIKLLKEKNG